MSQVFEITKEIEIISKDVLNKMTKRHYSRVSFMGLISALKKEDHTQEDILKSFLFLEHGKLIKIHKKEPFSSSYLELLDEKGQPIKNTMISSYKDDKYGIIFYSPESNFKNPITCYDHLAAQVKQNKEIIDLSCEKCFIARAQNICYLHKQSLEFCEKCRLISEYHKIIASENKDFGETEDRYISKLLKKHTQEYWNN